MGNLETFAKRMARRADDIPVRTTALKRRVGVAVAKEVVTATPFRTGRARYNWNVSLNSPDYSYDYDSFTSFTRMGDWLPRLMTSMSALATAGINDSIYISNGLPYIGELNRGWSPQAPPDYVRTAAIVGAHVVRNTKILR